MGEEAAVHAALGGLVAHATARTRSYFSPGHLWAAEHMARLADDIEQGSTATGKISIRHRSYVITSVMESAAYMEAFINEIFQDAFDGEPGALGGLSASTVTALKDAWSKPVTSRLDTLEKYKRAREAAGIEKVDAGNGVPQEAKFVILLRNWLVHYRPENLSHESPIRLIDNKRNRFPHNPFLGDGGAAWFPHHALSAGCAKWAARVARQYVEQFAEAIGSTRPHHRITHEEAP